MPTNIHYVHTCVEPSLFLEYVHSFKFIIKIVSILKTQVNYYLNYSIAWHF
jgi:hypothetical protein